MFESRSTVSLYTTKRNGKRMTVIGPLNHFSQCAMSLLINHDFVFHPSKICILEFEGTCQLSRRRPLSTNTQKIVWDCLLTAWLIRYKQDEKSCDLKRNSLKNHGVNDALLKCQFKKVHYSQMLFLAFISLHFQTSYQSKNLMKKNIKKECDWFDTKVINTNK